LPKRKLRGESNSNRRTAPGHCTEWQQEPGKRERRHEMAGKHNPIIVALDGMEMEQAIETAQKLKDHVWGFKANDLLDRLNSIDGDGNHEIGNIVECGKLFADPKYHDIPNTVGNRVKALIGALKNISFGRTVPGFITVHASGGPEMIKAAVEAAKKASGGRTKILVVTVLTSLNEEDCNLTYGAPVKAKVLQFSRWAVAARAHGIVCSGNELGFLSRYPELKRLIRMVPGIRPNWYSAAGDQKRVIGPHEAIRLGADYLVMGRAITEDLDPVGAVKKTMMEIQLGSVEEAKASLR
jgi:orotidine-5'-phosphate decarboxylase